MIHVDLANEPPAFDSTVRAPGRAWLSSHPDALVSAMPDYWRRCANAMLEGYARVCAYSSLYIPPVTGADTVEHVAPKSKHRDLAYEWSNYRLVCSLMNARKRDFEDVLDPFEIDDGLFHLDLGEGQVMADPALPAATRKQVIATIERLKLDDPECRTARREYYLAFQAGDIGPEYLRTHCPFVALEATRQGLM